MRSRENLEAARPKVWRKQSGTVTSSLMKLMVIGIKEMAVMFYSSNNRERLLELLTKTNDREKDIK